MKHFAYTLTLAIALLIGQSTSAQKTETLNLRVPNFARPLVEKWIVEYQKVNSDVNFQFVSGISQENTPSISLTTDGSALVFARYAVLPVTGKGTKAEKVTASHRLDAKELKHLFFVDKEWDDEEEETAAEKNIHILTGNSALSASRLYATHFQQNTSDYKGKKISGDDSFLNQALSRDPLGVTINSLPNIYDLKSRQLRPSLTLLPLDVDKQAREVLRNGNLDDILQLLESQQFDEIPVGHVALDYDRNNAAQHAFVQWVIANGVSNLHQYGLLQLSEQELTAQLQR